MAYPLLFYSLCTACNTTWYYVLLATLHGIMYCLQHYMVLCTACNTTWYHNPGDQGIHLQETFIIYIYIYIYIYIIWVLHRKWIWVCVLVGLGMPQQLIADWRCLRVECHGGEDTRNLAQELRRAVINGDSHWGWSPAGNSSCKVLNFARFEVITEDAILLGWYATWTGK